MLKHGEVNPLNVFGLRVMEHCPPHFERVVFDLKVQEKKITNWISEHLEGRYWIGDTYTAGSDERISMSKCVAFEEYSEASYFALFLDKINSYESDFLV